MNKDILFGLWIFLSLFSVWLPCECKSVPQGDGKGSLLIESVMNAAGIDASTMTTQSSVFVSKSGLIKGVASVAVPIHSDSKENSTTFVNATAVQIPTASEKMIETTESPSSNFTENNTTPALQTTIENTDVTTIAPENVTETATAPSNPDLPSHTNATEIPSTQENVTDGNHPELSGNTETTINPPMMTGNETGGPYLSNDTFNKSNSDIGFSNSTDYPVKAIELPIKIADAVSSLFGVNNGSAASNSSGEMTEFTLKVAVNWLTHNLTVSW